MDRRGDGHPGVVGRFRSALDRLTADAGRLEAEELKDHSASLGAVQVARCGDRQRVRIAGTLRAVTLRPVGGVPTVQAELWDGTGTVSLVWLGRRRIGGIEPGRSIVARGRVTVTDGHRVIYNPIYDLRPSSC